MKFTLATFVALAVAVVAKPAFLNTAFDVQQGEPFTLKYSGCENGCTITLLNGASKDLNNYKTLTAHATGDSFTFTLSGIPTDTYAFKITDNETGEYNYSSQFEYQGTGVPTTSASAASTTAVSTTAVSTTTAESTTAESTTEAVTTTKKATTLTKVTSTTEKPIVTPVHNATTPVSSHAASTKASSTEASSSAEASTSATTVPDSGAARLSSSIALIAGAVMAMVYLN